VARGRWRVNRSVSSHVEAGTHFLAGFEIGHPFRIDIDGFACARVAASAGVAGAGGEGAETAQFDATVLRQALGDFIEEGSDDRFNIADREVGIFLREHVDEFGTDHGGPPNAVSTGTRTCHSRNENRSSGMDVAFTIT
jgi:hypothetical protein